MTIYDWLGQHSITDTIVIFWVLSAAVNALPEPAPGGAGWYRWLYTFLTTIVGHLSDAIQQRRARAAQQQPAQQKQT